MRRKKKYKNFGITEKDVKYAFPFTWKTCLVCNDDFKLERMWATDIHINITLPTLIHKRRKYICQHCAYTAEAAASELRKIRSDNLKY